MKFRAELPVKPWPEAITYDQKIMLVGSCFTEHMGNYLADRKFNTLQNPNGILFNPMTICNAISSYIDNKLYAKQDIFHLNDMYSSWDYHSRFSNVDDKACLQHMNSAQQSAAIYLQQSNWLVITLGSAFVYTLTVEAEKNNCLAGKNVGGIVANCHKAPANWFDRVLLDAKEILTAYEKLVQQLFQYNRQLHIIFTISPVRHLREGLIDNNRSKAVLIQTVHALCEKFDRVHYFPAYEFVIDDLRDYRFYAEDLAHPNYQATQYVWEKFVDMCIDDKSKSSMQEIEKIRAAYLHKPLQPKTQQHQAFLQSYLQKIQFMQRQFPKMDFSREQEYFNNNLLK